MSRPTDLWLPTLEIGAAQRRSVTEIAPPRLFFVWKEAKSFSFKIYKHRVLKKD